MKASISLPAAAVRLSVCPARPARRLAAATLLAVAALSGCMREPDDGQYQYQVAADAQEAALAFAAVTSDFTPYTATPPKAPADTPQNRKAAGVARTATDPRSDTAREGLLDDLRNRPFDLRYRMVAVRLTQYHPAQAAADLREIARGLEQQAGAEKKRQFLNDLARQQESVPWERVQEKIEAIRRKPITKAAVDAATGDLAAIGTGALGPLMDWLHLVFLAKPGDPNRISPGYVREAIGSVVQRGGELAELFLFTRFVDADNEVERKTLFQAAYGVGKSRQLLALLLEHVASGEGPLAANSQWALQKLADWTLYQGWRDDEGEVAPLLAVFRKYPHLAERHPAIADCVKQLETVGVPVKETIFSPKLGGPPLEIAVDEQTEFAVALPRPDGPWGYHWGKGEESDVQSAAARRHLVFLGWTLAEKDVYHRFLGTRPVEGPWDIYVQGGVPDDDPPEYRLALSVHALDDAARAKKLEALAASPDKTKRQYALGRLKTGGATQPKIDPAATGHPTYPDEAAFVHAQLAAKLPGKPEPAGVPPDLKTWLPIRLGERFAYDHRADGRDELRTGIQGAECVQVVRHEGTTVGVYVLTLPDKSRNRYGVLLMPPRAWFVALEPLRVGQSPAVPEKTLHELVRQLSQIKVPEPSPDPENWLPEKPPVLGFLDFSPFRGGRFEANWGLPDDEFWNVGAEGFGADPWIPMAAQDSRRPIRRPRSDNEPPRPALGRGGRAVLQREVGLIHLHTWDVTRHGHTMWLNIADYRPTDPKRTEKYGTIDVDKTGSYVEGKWRYDLRVTPRVGTNGRLSWCDSRLNRGKGLNYVTPWGVIGNGGHHGRPDLPLPRVFGDEQQGRRLAGAGMRQPDGKVATKEDFAKTFRNVALEASKDWGGDAKVRKLLPYAARLAGKDAQGDVAFLRQVAEAGEPATSAKLATLVLAHTGGKEASDCLYALLVNRTKVGDDVAFYMSPNDVREAAERVLADRPEAELQIAAAKLLVFVGDEHSLALLKRMSAGIDDATVRTRLQIAISAVTKRLDEAPKGRQLQWATQELRYARAAKEGAGHRSVAGVIFVSAQLLAGEEAFSTAFLRSKIKSGHMLAVMIANSQRETNLVDALAKALENATGSRSAYLMATLARIGNTAAMDALAKRIKPGPAEANEGVIRAIAGGGTESSIALLKKLSEDKAYEASWPAFKAAIEEIKARLQATERQGNAP